MPNDPEGSCLTLPLSRGLEATIDAEDYEWASQYKWSAETHPTYPFRNDRSGEKLTMRRLHTEIMKPPPGYVVDHIDGNPLNNRRSNLRITDYCTNMRNRKGPQRNSTSHRLGVSQRRGKWRAYLSVNGKQKPLGTYDTLEEAVSARIAGELKYWGEPSAAYRRA